MGKRLQMAATGEYILWATIPETPKSSFNRAYGPFTSRSAAYSAKTALMNNKRTAMREEGYSPEEIEASVNAIEWATTGLWRKVEDDRLIDPVTVIPDTVEERAAEAIWNRSAPVVRGARPKWDEVRNDPEWRRGVKETRADAKAAIAAMEGATAEPAEESPKQDSI
ncbi:hypothetical protein ACVWY0_001110 [Arthrobacter sp. UYNi723]